MKKEFKDTIMWGIGSAGRAPALHAGGQEFESPILHHLIKGLLSSPFFNAIFPTPSGSFGLINLKRI